MNGDRPPEESGPAGLRTITGRSGVLLSRWFTAETVTTLRHVLTTLVTAAGLTGDAGYDFVLAVHELVANAVRHGGGSGRVDVHRCDDVLVCEVIDYGSSADSLPVEPPAADVSGGRGLWLAHQLTGGLMLTHRTDGTTATVSVCLTLRAGDVADHSTSSEADKGEDPQTEGEQP